MTNNLKLPDVLEQFYAFHSPNINEWEFRSMMRFVIDRISPIRNAVELGVCSGGISILLSHICTDKVIGVDLKLQDDFWLKAHPLSTKRLEIVVGDTNLPGTVETAKLRLAGPVDFLFIDAGHTYQNVKADYDLWSPLVRRGGLIAFHDIDPEHKPPIEVRGVSRLWNEVVATEKWEFIYYNQPGEWRGPGRGYGGVGVLTRL